MCDEKWLVYRPLRLAELLGIGKTKVYELIHTGQLRSVKAGAPGLCPRAQSRTS